MSALVARAAIGELIRRHVAAEPIGNVQRCGRCHKILVEHTEGEMVLDADAGAGRAMYFPIGAELVEAPGMLATASEEERRLVPPCGAVH